MRGRQIDRRSDPDPITITIAAIGALAGVGSLVINYTNREERMATARRAARKAKRQAFNQIAQLQDICETLSSALRELNELISQHGSGYDPRGPRPLGPSKRLSLPPAAAVRFNNVAKRVGSTVSSVGKIAGDLLDVLDDVGYEGEAVGGFVEQNATLAEMLRSRPQLEEVNYRLQDVAQSMKDTLSEIERELATRY